MFCTASPFLIGLNRGKGFAIHLGLWEEAGWVGVFGHARDLGLLIRSAQAGKTRRPRALLYLTYLMCSIHTETGMKLA